MILFCFQRQGSVPLREPGKADVLREAPVSLLCSLFVFNHSEISRLFARNTLFFLLVLAFDAVEGERAFI